MNIIVFILFSALSTHPVSKVDRLGQQGVDLFKSGQLELALDKFEQILALDKNNFAATLWKAECLVELKKYSESIEFYSIAISIKPKSAMAYYNRGVTYHKIHQYHKAEKDYLSALQLDPTNTDGIANELIHNNLGIVYGVQQNYDRAVIAYMNATRINKNYHEAHYNLGKAQEARSAFKAALKSYERALELQPDEVDYMLAVLRLKSIDY